MKLFSKGVHTHIKPWDISLNEGGIPSLTVHLKPSFFLYARLWCIRIVIGRKRNLRIGIKCLEWVRT